MNDFQPEGHIGKLHRTTKILSRARQRSGGVAARGARAAGGHAGDLESFRIEARPGLWTGEKDGP